MTSQRHFHFNIMKLTDDKNETFLRQAVHSIMETAQVLHI